MKRSEQKEANTWDLNLVYNNFDELKKDVDDANQKVNKIIANKDNLFMNVNYFDEFINIHKEINITIGKAYSYLHHKLDEDIMNETSQKNYKYIEKIATEINQKLSFLSPLIMENESKIKEYLEDDKYNYLRKSYENIFRYKKHTLNTKEEYLISLTEEMASIPYTVFSSLTDGEFTYEPIIVDGEKKELTNGNLYSFLINSNQEIRKKAFENYYVPFKKHNNTLAELFIGNIHQSSFYTKARNYTTNIEHSLFDSNIDVDVYNNLIKVVNDKIDINYKYINLRKKILKLDKINFYDLYVPLVSSIDNQYPFADAQKMVLNSLQIMGEEYINIIQKAFTNRWIDIYENEAKRSGAYSGGSYQTPPYILMNYTEELNDVFTLIHELGHSLHTYYSNENNDYVNANYKIFVAEIASTVNELILTDYLLKNSNNPKEKAYILNYLLEQFRSTVIRQTMFAEFERDTHNVIEEQQSLTKEDLNQMYLKLNQQYYGENMEYNEEIQYEWSRIPHFYYDFYVYQYATSFCAALQISKKILSGDVEFKNKYLDFLKVGNAKYPLDALKIIDIDLADEKVIIEAMNEYETIINQLEEELENV